MQLRNPLWPVTFLVLFSTAPSWAQRQDTMVFRAGYELQTDSNLYRLPSDANTQALLGRSSAAEQIGVTTLGVSFNKAYSLQRFEFDLSLVDYQYQNFNYLSFTAHNYAAAWRWSLSPRLHGSLSTNRKEVLNDFADYQGNTQRNQRTNTSTGFDAVYELDGPWRTLAGVSQTNQTNQQASGIGDDYSTTSANVGMIYAFASGSTVTYNATISSGQYLNRAASSTGFFDDEFSQLEHELRAHWALTPDTTVNLNAGYVSRSQPHFAERDFSGFNTGINFNWNITPKTALSASWSHYLSSYQTSYANYSQTDRLSLGPTWQVSPKVFVGLRYDVARIDYLGFPTASPSAQRKDTTHDATLSFNWQPYRLLTLGASLKKSTRDAIVTNLPALDYDSNMATLSAQLSF